MKKQLLATIAAVSMAAAPSLAHAGLLFKFSEVGSDVVMTASGSIDTGGLTAGGACGWGGIGIETNDDGETDILGNTETVLGIDTCLGFNAGTDQSAWLNPGGPFGVRTDDFFGDWVATGDGKAFSTYSLTGGVRNAGLGVTAADIEAGIWSISQRWVNADDSFATLGLVLGTFTVTDALSGEFMTIMVGGPEVPVPAAAPLMLAGLGFLGLRRKKKA